MTKNTLRIINKFIDSKPVAEYLARQQNDNGSYPDIRPHPINSMYCLKILAILNKKPRNPRTKSWVKSLQTGKRGFSETTGQNSWDYTTFFGSEMHKALGIRPRHQAGIKTFILSHQNKDGGFSINHEQESNLRSSIYWMSAAINLGFSEELNNNTTKYLLEKLNSCDLDYSSIYKILLILNELRRTETSKMDNGIIPELDGQYGVDFESFYYITHIFNILKKDFPDQATKYFEEMSEKHLFHSPKETFWILDIARLFDLAVDEKSYLNYVNRLELPEGGYLDKNSCSILTAYEAIQSLEILTETVKNKRRILKWVSENSEDGVFHHDCKFTFWGTKLRFLLGDRYFTEGLLDFLEKETKNDTTYNLFYTILTYYLLDILPRNHRSLVLNLTRNQNKDGGFSDQLNGKSNMYDTYRAFLAIFYLQDLQKKKKVITFPWTKKIGVHVINWLRSCENKTGGFSWIPHESSYIQPTYQALHISYALNWVPCHPDAHVRFIKDCQNPDGGFNGGEKGTPSSTLYTYYVLASMLIIDNFKQKNNHHLIPYLGL